MDTIILILAIGGVVAFAIYIIIQEKKRKANQPKPYMLATDYNLHECNEFDKILMNLINIYRVENGLKALWFNQLLVNVSYTHSYYMMLEDKVSHDFLDQRQEAFPDRHPGEIVAVYYSTALGFLNAWKNSPDHNEAMLNPMYKFIGLGTAYNDRGNKFICCMFLD